MICGERLNRPLLQMLSPGLEKLEFFVTGQPKSLSLEVDGSFGPLVVKGSKSGLKMKKHLFDRKFKVLRNEQYEKTRNLLSPKNI